MIATFRILGTLQLIGAPLSLIMIGGTVGVVAGFAAFFLALVLGLALLAAATVLEELRRIRVASETTAAVFGSDRFLKPPPA